MFQQVIRSNCVLFSKIVGGRSLSGKDGRTACSYPQWTSDGPHRKLFSLSKELAVREGALDCFICCFIGADIRQLHLLMTTSTMPIHCVV